MIAWIGIGANLGDAQANVLDAVRRLALLDGTMVVETSGLYRTAPIDSSGPDYVNAVACIDTSFDPHELLAALQAIELAHGRERPYRNAPRTLDLDLLLYGDQLIDTESLSVPHPRMHERAFVLAPLAEIAPDLVIPGRGPIHDFLPLIARQGVDKIA
ncbi:2-amino-4-hydroxy-6-hydroxymethyldihydropteridine diphosphokinase [Massilia yuzhufengensis]|uniref:2-amino-4-hydroxy-6-hydroxymethyldihydropteridine pyrophosphokinase n=1 Tax=Massilia yuzhufengensis TaxID=1164594 RepID=A0A1I1RH82_9BURK|nr:2-amino-4-hydroxy-6-hydroxymethyldihydropteridine diphosphokinase [Massilia yuzhufengensis]SFD33487.1 2-amino-4-hydroxy-6-hydroxymethyldihydropteridinediphosphokinase [Massilia yuzhufengensis]